jgi:hypothetical protein
VFAIDVSQQALANGLTLAAVRAVRSSLRKLRAVEAAFTNPSTPSSALAQAANAALDSKKSATNAGTKGGKSKAAVKEQRPCVIRANIITFDKDVQFYSVRLDSPDPVKMYVCCSEDPMCPLPTSHWLLEVTKDQESLELLLDRLPELVAAMAQGGSGDSRPVSGNFDGYSGRSTPVTPRDSTPRNLASGGGGGYGYSGMGSGAGATTPRGRSGSGAGAGGGGGGGDSGPGLATGYSSHSPCCVGAAIKSVQLALCAEGGRLLVLSSSHANCGYGALSRSREIINFYGTKDEIALYGCADAVIQVLLNILHFNI